MNSYEIEIKSLLGSKEKADALINKMKRNDKDLIEYESHKQLNHYFVPKAEANLEDLYKNTEHLIENETEKNKFKNVIDKAKKFSVRTANRDGKVMLVVKASIDDTTSENGTARIEFEPEIKGLTLEELDSFVLKSLKRIITSLG